MEIVPVRVAEVTAECDLDALPEIPRHLLGPPGEVAVQLRSTLRRVAIGAGPARDRSLVARVRALPGVPGVVTSPVGGTFIVGGPAWLGLAAIGTPAGPSPSPIDWVSRALGAWLGERLAPLGIAPVTGRVEGAWCPGFSDVGAQGRKLAGLGFRVTRDWVAMRGVLAVGALDGADLALLEATHGLIGVEVRREACTSLAELTGDPSWTVERAIALLRGSLPATGSAPVATRAG